MYGTFPKIKKKKLLQKKQVLSQLLYNGQTMNRNIDKVTSTKTWATTVIERQSREKDKK